MRKFKPSFITAALVASGMAFSSSPIYAQATPVEADETKPVESLEAVERIEITGFATSLIQSLNQKRFSDTVSEQISADDLGGLPDVSMADALTRLPGISAVRTGGQAAEINIRGLSGDFVFSTLNGREQVSTSGDRSIEFDQYPSELISSAAVYKSPKASLIEGGVAGTVELRTANPLSLDADSKLSVNARGMFNDRANEVADAEEFGHRFSFSYQTKFLDETLGLAIGYARLFQPSVSTQFIGLAYNAQADVDGLVNDTDGPADCPECENISEGFEMQHQGGEETRDGYMVAIEWAPVDNFTLKTDMFLSQFESEEFARGYRVKLGGSQTSVTNPILSGNDVIGGTFNRTSGSFTRIELVNDDNQDSDEVLSLGINADWQATDNLSLAFDVSYSKATSDFRNGLLWSLVAEDATVANPQFDENVSISYLLNGLDLPDLAFNQAEAFSDLDRVMVSKYGIYPFVNEDESTAYRFDFKYELDSNFVSSVEFGVRHSDRDYSNDRSVFEYGNDSAFSISEPPLRLTSDMVEINDWSSEFGYFPSYPSIDLDSALNAWFPSGIPQPVQTWGTGHPGVINSPAAGEGPNTAWSVQESGDVSETVTAAYIMANLDMEIGDLPITGNIGIRRVETEQSSTVLQLATQNILDPDTGEVLEVRGDPTLGAQYIVDDVGLINDYFKPDILTDKYTDYLPSLNLNFKLTDNQQLRFAAAKVMGRAPINRFAANSTTSVQTVTASQNPDTGAVTLSSPTARISGQSKNSPYLRPFYANQYDLSYEYYFTETDGAFVAALFYKDIQSFIEDIALDPYDFSGNGFVVPDDVNVAVFVEPDSPGDTPQAAVDVNGVPLFVTVPTENGRYETAVNNASGGYIRGLELTYTQIYDFLPGAWSGLGVSGSYSFTESEITRTLSGSVFSTDLPGLSENVAQFTVFWDYRGFETRLSTRYRDAFVSQQVAVNEQVVNFDSEIVMDYQASYKINENLSAVFQINNLTDEPTRSYFGKEDLTGTIQFFGTQYFLGVTYSL
ncbi:TonB-dependent receptor [Paraglaciecola psychrophila]|uniref:TonB-dependent receptor n=1 Tax=Paraglaciecola psychrophila 170 TaxID=1129794 RepID=K6ZPP1_9ALTE|nr:TonB-dependent receptor [Paraglaciecola psychrophila]AGH44346.1 TonB-dependent receptor [Paraglaciecola psychrophila 170]GAC37911.1 TonB-dependent receptor [Paraglaciecola psychrophila 170]